jgi:hypothetical protein
MTRGLRRSVQNVHSKYRKSLESTWLLRGTLKFCHVTLPASCLIMNLSETWRVRVVCGVYVSCSPVCQGADRSFFCSCENLKIIFVSNSVWIKMNYFNRVTIDPLK